MTEPLLGPPLLREVTGDAPFPPVLRNRMPQECSLGFNPNLIVAAESRHPIWKELFTRFRLIDKGRRYVRNFQYLLGVNRDGNHVMKMEYNVKAREMTEGTAPFVNVQTMNSWVDDMFWLLSGVGLLFLSKYSSVLFIANFQSQLDDRPWQFWLLVGGFALSFLVPLGIAFYRAKIIHADVVRTKDLILLQEDTMEKKAIDDFVGKKRTWPQYFRGQEHELWWWEQFSIFVAIWFLTFVGTPFHILQAPAFYTPVTAVGRKGLVKVGGARVCLTQYRSASEHYVLEREGQLFGVSAAVFCDIIMVGLKSWVYLTLTHGQQADFIFVVLSVGVPCLIDVYKLLGVFKLYSARQKFWLQLLKSYKNENPSIRRAAKDSLKKHYKHHWDKVPNSTKLFDEAPESKCVPQTIVMQGAATGNGLIAARFMKRIQELRDDLEYLKSPDRPNPMLQTLQIDELLGPIMDNLAEHTQPHHCTTMWYDKLNERGGNRVPDVEIGWCGDLEESVLKGNWMEELAKTNPTVATAVGATGKDIQLPGLSSRRGSRVFNVDQQPGFPKNGVIFQY